MGCLLKECSPNCSLLSTSYLLMHFWMYDGLVAAEQQQFAAHAALRQDHRCWHGVSVLALRAP